MFNYTILVPRPQLAADLDNLKGRIPDAVFTNTYGGWISAVSPREIADLLKESGLKYSDPVWVKQEPTLTLGASKLS